MRLKAYLIEKCYKENIINTDEYLRVVIYPISDK